MLHLSPSKQAYWQPLEANTFCSTQKLHGMHNEANNIKTNMNDQESLRILFFPPHVTSLYQSTTYADIEA